MLWNKQHLQGYAFCTAGINYYRRFHMGSFQMKAQKKSLHEMRKRNEQQEEWLASRMRRQAPPRGHRPCCSRRRKQTAWMRSLSKHATYSTPHAFGLAFFAVGVHLSALKVNGAVIIYCKTMSSCLGRLFDVIVHFIICVWWWCCCVQTKLASVHVPLLDANGTHGIDFVR